jgi:integrase
LLKAAIARTAWIPTELALHALRAIHRDRVFSTFRLLLDFAEIDPNPARDKRVKLPKVVGEEPSPPSAKQVLAILDNITDKPKILPLVLMEQTAIEPGVVASLEWGDVDIAENRLRLKRRNVKGNTSARARSPQVPGWLMELIEETCPMEDRTADRRVFPGLTPDALRNAMGAPAGPRGSRTSLPMTFATAGCRSGTVKGYRPPS